MFGRNRNNNDPTAHRHNYFKEGTVILGTMACSLGLASCGENVNAGSPAPDSDRPPAASAPVSPSAQLSAETQQPTTPDISKPSPTDLPDADAQEPAPSSGEAPAAPEEIDEKILAAMQSETFAEQPLEKQAETIIKYVGNVIGTSPEVARIIEDLTGEKVDKDFSLTISPDLSPEEQAKRALKTATVLRVIQETSTYQAAIDNLGGWVRKSSLDIKPTVNADTTPQQTVLSCKEAIIKLKNPTTDQKGNRVTPFTVNGCTLGGTSFQETRGNIQLVRLSNGEFMPRVGFDSTTDPRTSVN